MLKKNYNTLIFNIFNKEKSFIPFYRFSLCEENKIDAEPTTKPTCLTKEDTATKINNKTNFQPQSIRGEVIDVLNGG